MSNLPPTSASIAARSQYDLAFQISPIILSGGIAASAQGGLLPIIQFTGGVPQPGSEPFARYLPLPGSTLISQAVGMYPFANQAIAANATIQQPLTLSLVMVAPVNGAGGYLSKFHTFSALQAALQQHNASGGTYIVATPAFMYTGLLLTAMTDISAEITDDEGSKQPQIQYQLDFIQPIVTLAGAAAAQSALMQKVSNGSKITGPPSWSGNQSSSPANLTGVTGALGNVSSALSTFGEALP